jgi:glycosyltransferase involved in cell wall biosynthesis
MSKDKFKVMFVLSGLDIGGGHGGAERFGLELARSLDRTTFDVSVCAFWRRKTRSEDFWHQQLMSDGIPVHFAVDWGGKFNIPDYYRGVKTLISLCNTEKTDLLHSHFQMGTVASIITSLFSSTDNIVRTAHITLEWGERLIAWFLRKTLTNWVFPIVLDREIGVSKAIVKQLKNHPGARISRKSPRLIRNAIHPEQIRTRSDQPLPESLQIKDDDFVIGSIGRLVRQKAYEYLVLAAPGIIAKFPKARFILIGDGDDRQMLEDFALKNGTKDRFEFLGQVDEVYPLLKRMDLFVLPSRWEGFPTVILESMVCGIPVIASNIPGTDELIEDQVTGWLVPVENSEEIIDAVANAMNNDQLRERVIRNAKSLVEKYTFAQIANQHKETYLEILTE